MFNQIAKIAGIGLTTTLILIGAANQANANTTVTFGGVTPGGSSFGAYAESGFNFAGIGGTQHFRFSDTFGAAISNGTDFGFFEDGSQTIEITNVGGNPSSFDNFDAGNTLGQPGGLLTVTGNLNGGGTVSTNFNTQSEVFNTFNLPPTFTNLDSVTINSANNALAYDNVVFNSTPATSVPFGVSTDLSLMVLGGLYGVSRLRKKLAAGK